MHDSEEKNDFEKRQEARETLEKETGITMDKYKVKLPPGIRYLLEDLIREIIRQKPRVNLNIFAADHFQRRLEERALGVNQYDNNPTDEEAFLNYCKSPDNDRTKRRLKRRLDWWKKGKTDPKGTLEEANKAKSVRQPLELETASTELETAERLYEENRKALCVTRPPQHASSEDDVHKPVFRINIKKESRKSLKSGATTATLPPLREATITKKFQIADEMIDDLKHIRSVGIQEAACICVPVPKNGRGLTQRMDDDGFAPRPSVNSAKADRKTYEMDLPSPQERTTQTAIDYQKLRKRLKKLTKSPKAGQRRSKATKEWRKN